MASLETSRNFSSDLISVSTQAAIACGLSVAIIFSFELLRRKDRLWHLYSARTRLRYLPTPALPRRPFGWVRPIIQLDERFFLTHVGLDAVMHLRFLRMCMQIVLVACVICNVVLLPVNYLKGNNDPVDNGNHTRGGSNNGIGHSSNLPTSRSILGRDLQFDASVAGLTLHNHTTNIWSVPFDAMVVPRNNNSNSDNSTDQPQSQSQPQQPETPEEVARKKVSIHLFSLDHLGNKSNYFWFHLILLYALMLFIMYKLLRNTVDYVKMYADTLISESVYGQLSTRTILAEDIPKRLRSETALLKFFENLQVGNVEGTTVVRKYTELQKMLDKRKNIIDSLEINHISLARDYLHTLQEELDTATTHQQQIQQQQQQQQQRQASKHQRQHSASPLNPSANGETPHMDSMTSTLTDGNSTNRVSEQSAVIDTEVDGGIERGYAAARSYLMQWISQRNLRSMHSGREAFTAQLQSQPDSVWTHLSAVDRKELDRYQPLYNDIPLIARPLSRWQGFINFWRLITSCCRRRSQQKETTRDNHHHQHHHHQKHRLSRQSTATTAATNDVNNINANINTNNRSSQQCTIDNQLSKLDRVEKRLENLRDLSRIDKLYRPTNAAFITFETQTAAHLAAQAFVFSSPHQMKLSLAPEPRDVIWDNFLFDEREKFIRKLVVRLFSYGLIIVWLIPMTLILGLVSLEQLNRIKFFANIISNSTIVRNFLQNNLPSILFSMFMALLPMVLMYISNRQAFRSYSELEEAALEKHLLFLWLNVVVFFCLGTSVAYSLLQWVLSPFDIIAEFTRAISQKAAGFYINWIIYTTISHWLELAQIGFPLFWTWIGDNRLKLSTPRRTLRHQRPIAFTFFYYMPAHCMVFIITILYAVITPLILPFSLLYFAIGLLVYKHQFAVVYVKQFENHGRFWRHVINSVCLGMCVTTAVFTIIIFLKQSYVVAAATLPLFVLTIMYWQYMHEYWWKRMTFLPLDNMAVDINNSDDADDGDSDGEHDGGDDNNMMNEQQHQQQQQQQQRYGEDDDDDDMIDEHGLRRRRVNEAGDSITPNGAAIELNDLSTNRRLGASANARTQRQLYTESLSSADGGNPASAHIVHSDHSSPSSIHRPRRPRTPRDGQQSSPPAHSRLGRTRRAIVDFLRFKPVQRLINRILFESQVSYRDDMMHYALEKQKLRQHGALVGDDMHASTAALLNSASPVAHSTVDVSSSAHLEGSATPAASAVFAVPNASVDSMPVLTNVSPSTAQHPASASHGPDRRTSSPYAAALAGMGFPTPSSVHWRPQDQLHQRQASSTADADEELRDEASRLMSTSILTGSSALRLSRQLGKSRSMRQKSGHSQSMSLSAVDTKSLPTSPLVSASTVDLLQSEHNPLSPIAEVSSVIINVQPLSDVHTTVPLKAADGPGLNCSSVQQRMAAAGSTLHLPPADLQVQQDSMILYQTYLHPKLVLPLNSTLLLPSDPLRTRFDAETDCAVIDFPLYSTRSPLYRDAQERCQALKRYMANLQSGDTAVPVVDSSTPPVKSDGVLHVPESKPSQRSIESGLRQVAREYGFVFDDSDTTASGSRPGAATAGKQAGPSSKGSTFRLIPLPQAPVSRGSSRGHNDDIEDNPLDPNNDRLDLGQAGQLGTIVATISGSTGHIHGLTRVRSHAGVSVASNVPEPTATSATIGTVLSTQNDTLLTPLSVIGPRPRTPNRSLPGVTNTPSSSSGKRVIHVSNSISVHGTDLSQRLPTPTVGLGLRIASNTATESWDQLQPRIYTAVPSASNASIKKGHARHSSHVPQQRPTHMRSSPLVRIQSNEVAVPSPPPLPLTKVPLVQVEDADSVSDEAYSSTWPTDRTAPAGAAAIIMAARNSAMVLSNQHHLSSSDEDNNPLSSLQEQQQQQQHQLPRESQASMATILHNKRPQIARSASSGFAIDASLRGSGGRLGTFALSSAAPQTPLSARGVRRAVTRYPSNYMRPGAALTPDGSIAPVLGTSRSDLYQGIGNDDDDDDDDDEVIIAGDHAANPSDDLYYSTTDSSDDDNNGDIDSATAVPRAHPGARRSTITGVRHLPSTGNLRQRTARWFFNRNRRSRRGTLDSARALEDGTAQANLEEQNAANVNATA